MIKKLLFICIAFFAFSFTANAQYEDNIVIKHNGCQSDQINEFEADGTLNGKNKYRRMSTPTALGDSFDAIGGTTNIFIGFDSANNRWALYQNNFGTTVFEQTTDISGVEAPQNGWNGILGSCNGASIEVLSYGVLTVDRDNLDDKAIKVFPNPSSDFISVSNLKDAVQCRITNITGQTVISTVVDTNNNEIDVRDLARGFYFVEIEGKKTIKLIKK